MTGIVTLAAAVSLSLCRLCPWLNAPELVCEFGLKFIAAPKIPMSADPQNFIHPLCPDGITVSNGGEVRGNEFDNDCTSWQLPVLNEKL